MEEKNINDVLGLDDNKAESKVNPQQVQKVDNSRSYAIKFASSVLTVFMWISIVIAIVSGVVYASYVDAGYTEGMRTAAIAGTWFQDSVFSIFGCYFMSQLFKGISVISEAAEKYLSTK